MNSCALIIPICRHTLPDGRRCQQPAVRGRTSCRHHLDALARLHNMARARRRSTILRLRVPETFADLAWNEIELNRVLATQRLDPAIARLMHYAMDLSAAALNLESAEARRNCTSNSHRIYDVPVTPVFPGSLRENLSQVLQNTDQRGRGYTDSELP